jgi:hypothetical protein
VVSLATYRAKYDGYTIDCRNIDVAIQSIDFERGVFRTDNEEIIEFLDGHLSRGVNFFRIDDEQEDTTNWRDRLEPSDNPEEWSDETLRRFKNGEEVFRCEYECGYANHHKPATASHENHCSSSTDDSEEEE